MELDLDAARAARTEKTEKKVLRFGGKKFPLPPELPIEVAELWQQNDWRGGIVALLNGKADGFMAAHPSLEDLSALADGLAKMYGFAEAGESSASSGS